MISKKGIMLIMELALLTEAKSHSVIYESEEKVEGTVRICTLVECTLLFSGWTLNRIVL